MPRTTYKIEPGKYLHMPTQSIVENFAHGDWRLLNSQGVEIGKFGSKSDALRLLNRGDKTASAADSNGNGNGNTRTEPPTAEETQPIPTQRPEGVRPAPAERDGVPANAPLSVSRLDYLTRVVECVAPAPPGRMYVVLEIPAG